LTASEHRLYRALLELAVDPERPGPITPGKALQALHDLVQGLITEDARLVASWARIELEPNSDEEANDES